MDIPEILEQVDIVDYISQFCYLEERGDGEYWGLSPLKDEKTPSFSVNKEKQIFFDFSSGSGGNVLEFIKRKYGCTFYSALNTLKKYANIKDDVCQESAKRLEATSIAKKYKTKKKPDKESKSVILQQDYMDRYEMNDEKLSVWKSEGITSESMKKFHVRYDPFSNRIVFPIRNTGGDIINVCGRTLDQNYKENKIRKYTYFKPLGILDTIYGLSEHIEDIKKKKEIILFEGAKSVMIADGWGYSNTGAILTSHLNKYQFRILMKLGVRVVFALDADVDIRKDDTIMKLIPYTQVEWVCNNGQLLDEKDAPVDKGINVFKKLYNERRRLR